MSWNSYIDNLADRAPEDIDKVCIIGIDGSKWTTDDHAKAFKVTPQEASKIATVCKSADKSAFSASGITAEGVKYMFLRQEGNNISLFKKKDHGAITLQQTKTAVLLVHCKEGGQHGKVNKATADVAQYMEDSNI